MDTIQIKSTDEATQGPFVVINAEDFDADKHELFGVAPADKAKATRGSAAGPSAKKADLQALLDAPAQ